MSERHDEHEDSARTPEAPPSEMRLRPSRPTVTRLSRKVLLGLGAVTAIGIAGALFFALKSSPQSGNSELLNTANRSTPEGISELPRDYTGLPRNPPRLGPPLPGDLGKPMLNAGVTASGMPSGGPMTPEEQRIAQEQDAARTSHLFASMDNAIGSVSVPAIAAAATTASSSSTPSASNATTDHKLAFVNADIDHHTQSAEQLAPPAGPYVLQAGSVIPAALVTGLRSDLPGEVTAQVTQAIFDSKTGATLLIPQGSKLLGQYDAQISFGQSRALLVWNRLILPNGKSIVLERQPATDTEGYTGLEDEVDNHWGMLFEAAALSTILSVGAEAGTGGNSEDNLSQAIRQGMSQSFNQAGEQVVGRSLNVQPTITIRPGFLVNVLVTHDLVLEPYRE
jgi:type IV secretion system protein TrbI